MLCLGITSSLFKKIIATLFSTADIARPMMLLRELSHSEGTSSVASPVTLHYQLRIFCEHGANSISVVLCKSESGFH